MMNSPAIMRRKVPMLDALYLTLQLAKVAALVLAAYAFTYLMLAI